MMKSRSRPGYIFLMTVLFTGIIGLTAVISLMLLSWASEQSGVTFTESTQALEMANTCTEYALQKVRSNPFYAGGDSLVFDKRGTCTISAIQRKGDARIICTEGASGLTKRRMQVRISKLFPNPFIEVFKEDKDLDDCL